MTDETAERAVAQSLDIMDVELVQPASGLDGPRGQAAGAGNDGVERLDHRVEELLVRVVEPASVIRAPPLADEGARQERKLLLRGRELSERCGQRALQY